MAEQPNPLDIFGSGSEDMTTTVPTNGQDMTIPADPAPSTTIPIVHRKQNVACDACRAKKIRCQRTSTAEKCAQCIAKDAECTSHYIEQLQNKTKKARRKTGDGSDVTRKRAKPDGEAVFDDPVALLQEVSMATLQSTLGDGTNGETSRAGRDRMSLGRNPLQKTGSERKDDLLQYLFSPHPVAHYDWGYTDLADMEQCLTGGSDLWEEDGGRVWVEEPTQAHLSLGEAQMKELADDLLETYFSIAHPRWPAFDPGHLKARFQNPDTHPDGPAEQPLIALCVAFGARFSDHPTLERDRDELAARDELQYGAGVRPRRSRIVQLLVIRCREVVEAHKCHRVRKLLNALILVNLEGLLAQVPTLGSKYVPYHYQAAVKHIIVLGYNNPENLLAIKDEKERAQAVNAWWMTCLVDGFRSVFHRLPSSLNEINYTAPDIPDGVMDKPPGLFGDQADQAVIWFSAASTSSALCRDLSRGLWNAKAMQDGIRVSSLRGFVSAMTDWKNKYLATLGVPEKVPDSWEFFNAITATGTDTPFLPYEQSLTLARYLHTLWLVIERAIKDFGIYELKQKAHGGDVQIDPDYEEVRKRIKDEAEHAALRITGLISVLKANQYLRLDPLILYHPICEAGWYLAAQGRSEAQACVDGLKQYALAYPSFWDMALDMERTLALTASALSGNGGKRQSLFETNDPGSIGSAVQSGLGDQSGQTQGAPSVRTPIGVSTLPGSIPRELSEDAGAILSGFLQQR